MRYKEAIAQADSIRPNVQSETEKMNWLLSLEAEVAEMMGLDCPPEPPETEPTAEGDIEEQEVSDLSKSLYLPVVSKNDPEGFDLLLPPPKDHVYVLYLVAMIDYYNTEMDLYANDYAVYNAEMANVRAWWRRHHRSAPVSDWRV